MIAELALLFELACMQVCPTLEHVRHIVEQPAVAYEMQWIAKQALNSNSELGGQVCADEYRFRFKQIRNKSGDNIFIPATADVKDIKSITEKLTGYFAYGECSPYNQSFSWQQNISSIIKHLEDARDNPSNREILEGAIESYNRLLNSTYHQEEAENCKMHVGNFHTHDNGTNSSNTDLCINRDSLRNDFLISVDKQAPEMFKLYILQDGIEAIVGTYQIENI